MILEPTVTQVREGTDLVALIRRFVPLKKSGLEFEGCCPFHNEKSPSFKVNAERYHCFGCGAHGDAIRFLQDHKGLDFPDAVKELAGPLGIHVDDNASPRKLDRDDYSYRDPEPEERSVVEPEFRPRKKPRGDDDAPPFDWDAHVMAFTPEDAAKLAKWRGYSLELVERLHGEKLIGLYQGKPAIAVHDDTGAVVRCHYRLDDGRWMYFPKHGETAPLVIGDIATAGYTLAFESQWDAFAALDVLGYHEDPCSYAAIITRGATSNTDIGRFAAPVIIAVPQNDPIEKRNKKTGRTPAEDWLEKIRETRAAGTRVLVAKVPDRFKDANDWTRDAEADPVAIRKALIESARSPLLAGFKTAAEIRRVDIGDDPNSMLGFKRRWLGRGGSLIVVGPSGIGKSTLLLLMTVCWAAGIPFFGIQPRRPMKMLVIQAENDDGDLREMIDGAIEAMGTDLSPAQIAVVERNILFRHETERTGMAFCSWLEEAIRETDAEMVFADPLLSYIGDDVSSQKVCSEFLRTWLQPVLARTGAMIAFAHHTGKTSADSKSRAHWTDSDGAYLGIGSSELTNWARSVATLVPATKDSTVFRFSIAKRGGRAGMISRFVEGPVKSLFLAHAEKGLGWREVEEPDSEPARPGGRKRSFSEDDVLTALGHPSVMTAKDQLVADLSAKFSTTDRTVRNALNALFRRGMIEIAKTEPRAGGGPALQYLRKLTS